MKRMQPGFCQRCGTDEHVHEGLCRRCRKVLLAEGTPVREARRRPPRAAQTEPLHNPPWRRRGA
ncbi:MAG: hypothetical protein KGJ77_07835 [Acidobacteriota bacterium]|nr:hypothetical protein [Acidobacteriota bacterium]